MGKKLSELPRAIDSGTHTFERDEEESDTYVYQARGDYQVFDDDHDEAWTPELERDATLFFREMIKDYTADIEFEEKGWVSVTVTEKE